MVEEPTSPSGYMLPPANTLDQSPRKVLAAVNARIAQGALAMQGAETGAAQAALARSGARGGDDPPPSPATVSRPKGWDQCLKFARYVKSQEVSGVELVRVWESTCQPS